MFEVEVRATTACVYRVADLKQAARCAGDALAAWGIRAPDGLTVALLAEHLAEGGEYSADVDWAHLRIRRSP